VREHQSRGDAWMGPVDDPEPDLHGPQPIGI
jgi:hypothetical protein